MATWLGHCLSLRTVQGAVRLWHPIGNGDQPRYNITAVFSPGGASPQAEPASTWRLLGFRHVALVTINDTDVAAVTAAKDQDGTGQFGMFFRVNGAAVYARGGNKIPMDLIDGRMTAYAHRRLVQTAAEGNMNMLRSLLPIIFCDHAASSSPFPLLPECLVHSALQPTLTAGQTPASPPQSMGRRNMGAPCLLRRM